MGEILGNQVSASAAVRAEWEQELKAAQELAVQATEEKK